MISFIFLTALIFRFSFASSISAIVVSPSVDTLPFTDQHLDKRLEPRPELSVGREPVLDLHEHARDLFPVEGLLQVRVIEGMGIAELEQEEDHPLRPPFADQTDEVVRPVGQAPVLRRTDDPLQERARRSPRSDRLFSSIRPLK